MMLAFGHGTGILFIIFFKADRANILLIRLFLRGTFITRLKFIHLWGLLLVSFDLNL